LRLTQALGQMNVEVTPSQANFVFCHFQRPAREIYDQMLLRGVILRPFAKLPNSLRITVGTEAENARMLEALGEVLT
jgi:histidinol-phosphate aminotransferase